MSQKVTAKPTPRPWRVDVRTGCVAVYQGAQQNCLDGIEDSFLFYRQWPWDEDNKEYRVNEQDIADAYRIAATLDLLEACKEGLAHMEDGSDTDEYNRRHDLIVAAIDKAENCRK